MSASYQSLPAEAVPEFFAPSTQIILRRAGVETAHSFFDQGPGQLTEAGFLHLVTDWDGVVVPYGLTQPSVKAMEHLANLAEALEAGVSIVTNNWRVDIPVLPRNIRTYRPASIGDFKPSPRLVSRAVQEAGVTPETTHGIADGLTDLIAYKRAGLGGVVLAKSIGAHPAQEAVHQYVYTPVVRAIAPLVSRLAS